MWQVIFNTMEWIFSTPLKSILYLLVLAVQDMTGGNVRREEKCPVCAFPGISLTHSIVSIYIFFLTFTWILKWFSSSSLFRAEQFSISSQIYHTCVFLFLFASTKDLTSKSLYLAHLWSCQDFSVFSNICYLMQLVAWLNIKTIWKNL